MSRRLETVWKTMLGLLRELSDQNAYQRYLDKKGLVHSGETWRAFHEHRLACKYQRAKCC